MVSMEGDEDIRGGTMEELPVGLAVGGDRLCAQRVVETAYAQGGEAVISDDGIGIGGFEHHAKRDMRDKERWRCGERGGNSTNSRCKSDGGATREEAMQQPTSTREVQRKERDGGVTREGRGGMARFARAAQQKAMQHESQMGR